MNLIEPLWLPWVAAEAQRWMTLVMEIKNSQGQIIFQYDGDFRKANLDDIDLSGAMLENADLEGVVWCGTNLSRANLKAADFYWAILFTSNLSYADLQEAQFRRGSERGEFSGCQPDEGQFRPRQSWWLDAATGCKFESGTNSGCHL